MLNSHPYRMRQYSSLAERAIDGEVSGLTVGKYNEFIERGSYLHLLASGILSEAAGPAVFDVSPLVDKLPTMPIWNHTIEDVVLSAPMFFYVDFGHLPYLNVGDDDGFVFEGAYVHQLGDEEGSAFMLYLVFGDPDFGKQKPDEFTMRRLANSIQIEIGRGQTVLDAIRDSFLKQDCWAEEKLQRDPKAIAAAFNIAVKSLIYMAKPNADIAFGEFGAVVGENESKIGYLDIPHCPKTSTAVFKVG